MKTNQAPTWLVIMSLIVGIIVGIGGLASAFVTKSVFTEYKTGVAQLLAELKDYARETREDTKETRKELQEIRKILEQRRTS